MSARPVVAVIGGGLSGLVAAYQFRLDVPDARILVIEASDQIGGKLDTVDFPSGPVELGAEAFIGRRPEAAELVAELGLTETLEHPSALGSAILSQGRLHPMPPGTVMGIPSDASTLAGLLDAPAMERARFEESMPLAWNPGQDASVGALIADRFGPMVVARLVDPMLGGVYAAPSAGLGLREVIPGLAEVLDSGVSSLTEAARILVSRRLPGPVFATFSGGYREFVNALGRASAAEIRTGVAATSVRTEGDGFILSTSGASGEGSVAADAVILALPVPDAVPLLMGFDCLAAMRLDSVRTSSSAVVAMEVDRDLDLPQHSGVLVATDEPVPFKAMTFSSRKWPHLDTRPGHIVRVSFGRLGADDILACNAAALTDIAVEALAGVAGGAPKILHSQVRKWTDGLPEIGLGHDTLIAEIRGRLADCASGLELIGAATEGVGVPACISSARAAARRLAAQWQD